MWICPLNYAMVGDNQSFNFSTNFKFFKPVLKSFGYLIT